MPPTFIQFENSARVSESERPDEAIDAGKSPEIMSMLRSRRLSIGAAGSAIPAGPDLLKPLKEEGKKKGRVYFWTLLRVVF